MYAWVIKKEEEVKCVKVRYIYIENMIKLGPKKKMNTSHANTK